MTEVITDREIKILEFDQIRQKLASLTVSPVACKMAKELKPSSDPSLVQRQQQYTSEGRLLCAKNAFNPSAVEDIKPLLTRAEKGAVLSGPELAVVMAFLQAAQRWSKFFKNSDHVELYPLMAALASKIEMCSELDNILKKSLDHDGNILDSASSALSSLRRKKLSLQNNIRDKLDQYIRSSQYRRYLQDALVTIRSGRFVLPVKQEYRHNLEGVVHDQSSSGATIFIEPLPVVEMQNSLTSLQRQEEEEIERILYQLSGQVAAAGAELSKNRNLYSELDFITARGRLSLELGGCEPFFLDQETPLFYLYNAVHPLLSGKKVPLAVELGEPAQTLVVTGPNTGGKTVALKSIGLLAIMAQSGLQLPAGKETKMTVFKKIRADIGDEQSIVQSLSTFSGHMKNIIAIVEEAGPGSLVLFDELGAGTDPSEGSALAMAILEELTQSGALTVATTHINELKLFAQAQDKMQNAAMEFDLDTLAPTYRLMQGIPGQSNAFHIAAQLGLPAKVLEKAKSYMHRSHDQVESIIASLVEDQQRYSRDSRQAELERSRAELLMADLEKEHNLLRARQQDIIKEAREEARQIVRKTKSAADQILRELREIKSTGVEQPVNRAEQLRSSLNELRRENEPEDEGIETKELCAEDLAVGMLVYIRSLKQKGEIISFENDEAAVQVGSIKVNLPIHELSQVQTKEHEKAVPGKAGAISYSLQKEPVFSNSLDLRGLTLEEAVPLVEKLLDNSLWAGLKQVSLIHGKGTGKLKHGLQSYLKEHKLIRSFRNGKPEEGGEGVTIVDIDS